MRGKPEIKNKIEPKWFSKIKGQMLVSKHRQAFFKKNFVKKLTKRFL